MTDPTTPTTEAGRRKFTLMSQRYARFTRTEVAAIEAQARADERRRLAGLVEAALEAEWYNGNLDEKAYRRLCKAAGVKVYPSTDTEPAP